MRKVSVIAIAALLAIPAASATWYAYGTYEPDTKFDQDGPMFENADKTAGGKKIYFNVFQTQVGLGMSVNNGLLGSRIQQAGVQNFHALFGPWVDCSKDDAIGLEESALYVYPSSVLDAIGDEVCPVGSPQNDGQWVYEHIPIGYDPTETPQNKHPMQIDDPDALVWGDIGYPGFAATGSCPISPLPHGTTAGTGWLLRYVDCFTAERVQDSITANDPTGGSLAWTCDGGDCNGNPQKSDSALNVHFPESLFGNPETGETGTLQLDSEEDGGAEESAYTTWNCGSRLATVNDNVDQEVGQDGVILVGTKRVVIFDPTFDGSDGLISGNYGKEDQNFTEGGQGDEYAWVAQPAPAVHDPSDSVADGLNGTFRGFRIGGGDEAHDNTVGGDCNTDRDADGKDGTDGENTYSGLHQTAFFRADAPFEPPSQTGKKETDELFTYFNSGEQEGTEAEVFGPNAPPGIVTVAPQRSSGLLLWSPGWYANTFWATTPQAVNRNTLEANAPAYWSFYAKLNTTDLLINKGYEAPAGAGVYGSEACGTVKTGVLNGWDCDPTHWYTDANFQPIVDGNEIWAARAHFPYQFRDVDCYDGSVGRNTGVFASLVQLSRGVDSDRNGVAELTCTDSTLGP